MKDNSTTTPVPIGPRIVASGGFELLYREGMGLIEDVAAYLDGAGRTESRGLQREASFCYATESMRLTTRLMQLASWLLLQRAVNEGELTAETARTEKEKVKFSATPSERGGPGFDELPANPSRLHRQGRPAVRPRAAVRQARARQDGSGASGLRGERHGSAVPVAGGVRPAEGVGRHFRLLCHTHNVIPAKAGISVCVSTDAAKQRFPLSRE